MFRSLLDSIISVLHCGTLTGLQAFRDEIHVYLVA